MVYKKQLSNKWEKDQQRNTSTQLRKSDIRTTAVRGREGQDIRGKEIGKQYGYSQEVRRGDRGSGKISESMR